MQYKMSWMGYGLFILILGASLWLWKSGNNQAVFYAINMHHNMLPTSVWGFFNLIAYSKYFILPAILLITAGVYRRDALLRIIILIIAYYVVFKILKLIFGEARPYLILPSNSFFWLPNADAAKIAYQSFPSGHTGLAAIFVFALMQIFYIRNLGLKLLLLLFVALVACARICTGWHWPLDTLASGLIGFILVKLCFINYKKSEKF